MKLPNNLSIECTFVFICLFFLFGFISGIVSLDLVKDSNWPDIITAWITTLAFLLALRTYFKWLETKINDDSYTAAVKYINILSELEQKAKFINYGFEVLTVRPGKIPISEAYAKNTISNINLAINELDEATARFADAKSDLSFWGVSLASEEGHKETYETLQRIYRLSDGLLNCFVNDYIHKDEDHTKESWEMPYKEALTQLVQKENERKKSNMKSFFIFKNTY
jgi:hypothetical protein